MAEADAAAWRAARQVYMTKYRGAARRPPQNELEKAMEALEERLFNPPTPEAHEARMNELEATYGKAAGAAVRTYDKWLRERYNLIDKYR